jgi:hypothetical protein
VESVNGSGLSADDLAAAVIARREEAQAEHDASFASAAATREHAASLNQAADDMEEAAEAALAAALAAADALEKGA